MVVLGCGTKQTPGQAVHKEIHLSGGFQGGSRARPSPPAGRRQAAPKKDWTAARTPCQLPTRASLPTGPPSARGSITPQGRSRSEFVGKEGGSQSPSHAPAGGRQGAGAIHTSRGMLSRTFAHLGQAAGEPGPQRTSRAPAGGRQGAGALRPGRAPPRGRTSPRGAPTAWPVRHTSPNLAIVCEATGAAA